MDLIFFDLDGTLLNKASKLSAFTIETLCLLKEKDIAHTVATGRTMLSARRVIGQYAFDLPHIFSNGVAVWDPRDNGLKLDNLLNHREIAHITDCALSNGLAPFVNTMATENADHKHEVFHGNTHHQIEKDLIKHHFSHDDVTLYPLNALPADTQVTNISMIGATPAVAEVFNYIEQFKSLIAYSGPAEEGGNFSWIDVHHNQASKGSAVEVLKDELGASNVICFGDSDNDLSMFQQAHECYAPANANNAVKEKASAIIGHHHEDGVAHFLRERFSL